jgi:hypothetical protein
MTFSSPRSGTPRCLRSTSRCVPTECQRVFRCGPCRALVTICRACDRGQRYCSAACRKQERAVQLRAAGQRCQRKERGRLQHAARQRAYWARRGRVELDIVVHAAQEPAAAACPMPPQSALPGLPVAAQSPVSVLGASSVGTAQRPPTTTPRSASPALTPRPLLPRPQPRCIVCDQPSGWWISHFRLPRPRRRRRAR